MTRTWRLAAGAAVVLPLAVSSQALERVATQEGPPPRFQVDPPWPTIPPQWVLGQVSGLDVDSRDHVWIIQRPWSVADDEKAQNPEAPCCVPAPPVMEFDAAGHYVQGWGGPGEGYEWPADEHTIHIDYKDNVAVDSQGNVFTAEDGGGRRVQKFLPMRP